MRISQHDVAQVDTDTLKLLVLAADEAEQTDPRLGPIWRHFKHALIRAVKERRLLELLVEVELMNDDGPGALVGPDDDPVADALRELRGERP